MDFVKPNWGSRFQKKDVASASEQSNNKPEFQLKNEVSCPDLGVSRKPSDTIFVYANSDSDAKKLYPEVQNVVRLLESQGVDMSGLSIGKLTDNMRGIGIGIISNSPFKSNTVPEAYTHLVSALQATGLMKEGKIGGGLDALSDPDLVKQYTGLLDHKVDRSIT